VDFLQTGQTDRPRTLKKKKIKLSTKQNLQQNKTFNKTKLPTK